jgi:hypothetical protein
VQRHLKSCFQMLRHIRLNGIIMYFASVESFDGYRCAQVFFGMASNSLYAAGMITESEFSEVFLDFILQYGIPSTI